INIFQIDAAFFDVLYDHEKSDPAIVCAGQRMSQEGSSPSGARMRSAVSKGGGNASPASGEAVGRQGVRSDPESEGFEEKYRAVINGGHPDDEQAKKVALNKGSARCFYTCKDA